jgi:hypothetical protein
MRAQFFDRQDETNPLNGKTLSDPTAMRNIIQSMQQRAPFLAALIGENGRALLRYCLPMPRVAEIAAVFLDRGERASDVVWEEI